MRDPIINIAIEAARAAGNTIVRAIPRLNIIKVAEKQPNDYVTEIDQRVEQEIITIIKKAYPSHGILGEESGEQKGDDYQWIIDPLDGTRNFIHGFPHFAVSIAVTHKNKIEHGVIYDPIRQELFTATRGKGAQLNERRIRVSTRKRLSESLLGTGFAYRHQNIDNPVPGNILQQLLPACGDIRRAGAATLDLAYVACGRLDGFWEFGLHLWDIAAGLLLVKEAGGMVCDPHGGEDYLKTGNIVTANPAIMRQLLKMIRPQLEA
ncbi:inositol monophosphatase family protein [Aquicella lusitana]|uniref:Inositol-1-monophosphatase n=1 Tax=Aquicella lusitana TaxID=254246 RepID=A0A370GT75_9COXI|nr:inositol monophosphatase family protein [Aquicella lusitana]RDI46898.1 myo-inositol-1(or 4)-monophosphatase [Aquicella lusitana]VVC73789.1 Inositol-1-monophosphatase [Aquicella lusitana]